MSVEESYMAVAPFFDLWVSVMEVHTRKMEVLDAKLHDSRTLIICPPTDRGMEIIARANSLGESHLFCISHPVKRIAEQYMTQNAIENLIPCVGGFFTVPFADEYFDNIFANCFFDFCRDRDFPMITREIKRALRPGGDLLAVYMGLPSNIMERVWVGLFHRIQRLSQGCRPVNMKPFLTDMGFSVKTTRSVGKLGFPIEYVHAEKPVVVDNEPHDYEGTSF